uniref:Uncharacterized protein n=1 Tax=Musca domestica TaxID=7370 RepID=A0A1I8NL03_MUSDO
MYRKSAQIIIGTDHQAERSVQRVKNAFKAMCHSSTGHSPAQLFLGRQLRTRSDLVRPQETSSKVTANQFMKSSCKYRELEKDQNVYFLSGNPRIRKWLKGKVTKRLGDVHYQILFQGNRRTPVNSKENSVNRPNSYGAGSSIVTDEQQESVIEQDEED